MQKHIVDHPKPLRDATRLKQYLDIERSKELNPGTKEMQRQAHDRDSNARVEAYVNIEKGRRA